MKTTLEILALIVLISSVSYGTYKQFGTPSPGPYNFTVNPTPFETHPGIPPIPEEGIVMFEGFPHLWRWNMFRQQWELVPYKAIPSEIYGGGY